jgi:hypothetical protein
MELRSQPSCWIYDEFNRGSKFELHLIMESYPKQV